MLLVGDVGGTKTVLALYEDQGHDLVCIRDATYPSREHATFEEIVRQFLADGPQVSLSAGCFGVAGPVINGRCETTNLPWELEERELAHRIGAPRAKLLNDLEAAAYGMPFLKPEETCFLSSGENAHRQGNVAIIAAGTGLGEAFLYWDGKYHHPVASEGGHADFAPRSDQEIELLRYLRKKYQGHVSYERVLSGPGFLNIYSFLRDTGFAPESAELKARLEADNPNVVISELGLAGADPLCAATLELFAGIYGSEAGNLALKCVAVGGLYVGGGIAPKILPALQTGTFMRNFVEKGRFSELLSNMPVRVALNPRAPLLGAAHYARRLDL